jgi:hypothetical protein
MALDGYAAVVVCANERLETIKGAANAISHLVWVVNRLDGLNEESRCINFLNRFQKFFSSFSDQAECGLLGERGGTQGAHHTAQLNAQWRL